MKKYVRVIASLFLFLLFSKNVNASEGFADLVKLVRENVGYDVLQAYVRHSGFHYNLTADEVVLLNDLGVPATILDEILSKQEAAPASVNVSASDPGATSVLASTMTLAPAPQDANISLFYDALSPFGTWSQEKGLGWVWTPTAEVYDTTWKPYATDGSWVWTNTGWFWNSHYSWGWAPFHFGRWEFINKWVWVPDVTWGPSWVTWRKAQDFFGWAPLPTSAAFDPHTGLKDKGSDFGLKGYAFSFVPPNRFLTFDIGAVLVPQDQIENIINRSKVINNYEVSNGTVINRGISANEVAFAMKRRLPAINVEWAKVRSGDPIPPTIFEGRDKITTYNVVVANNAPLTPPQAIEHRNSPEEAQRRSALVEQAQQQRTKYSQFEDQRIAMLAGQVHFEAEAERRRHNLPPASPSPSPSRRPVPTAPRISPGAQPAAPRSQQLQRSEIQPSSSTQPASEQYRKRMEWLQYREDWQREHAGKVQAKADAAERARQADIASFAAMEYRALLREAGNNRHGTDWERGIEIQRQTENLFSPEEPSRPDPEVFQLAVEEIIREQLQWESQDTNQNIRSQNAED